MGVERSSPNGPCDGFDRTVIETASAEPTMVGTPVRFSSLREASNTFRASSGASGGAEAVATNARISSSMVVTVARLGDQTQAL